MTNPRCSVCRGWGYVPDKVPMEFCSEPWTPRRLNGQQPCTPRAAAYRDAAAPHGVTVAVDRPGVMLPSEKRAALRNA